MLVLVLTKVDHIKIELLLIDIKVALEADTMIIEEIHQEDLDQDHLRKVIEDLPIKVVATTESQDLMKTVALVKRVVTKSITLIKDVTQAPLVETLPLTLDLIEIPLAEIPDPPIKDVVLAAENVEVAAITEVATIQTTDPVMKVVTVVVITIVMMVEIEEVSEVVSEAEVIEAAIEVDIGVVETEVASEVEAVSGVEVMMMMFLLLTLSILKQLNKLPSNS